MNSLFFCSIYIPHWLDSMEAIFNLVKLNMIIYIPHWLDSMILPLVSYSAPASIYIPHWLDSMQVSLSYIRSSHVFTFHTG